jgi:isopentenyl-diphosphate delta-isomerase
MAHELLDIVDQADRVIGQKTRSEVYSQGLSNFRVVNAFLMNENGQLWIPRRSKNKILFPQCLDASMGGHVQAGEKYEQAFSREIREELRIDTAVVPYQLIGVLTPQQHKTSAFMHVYLLKTNNAPNYNTDDFFEYYWLTPRELLDRLAAGDSSKDDLPRIVRNCFNLFHS